MRVPRPGRAGHRRAAAARAPGTSHETVPGARRQGPHDPAGGRARARRRHRAALGHRLRHRRSRRFVNIIATPKGGTHVAGFERALVKTRQRAAARARSCSRPARTTLEKDDVLEGLTAVVTVRLAEPQFEGQTKEVLGTPAAARIVAHVVRQGAHRRSSTSTKRGDKAQARAVLEKVAAAMRTRIARAPAQGDSSAARTRWRPRRCRPSSPTAAATTSSAPSCSSSRATRALGTAKLARNARVPGAAADPRQDPQRPEGLRRATCSRTPSAPSIIQVIGAGLGAHLRPRRRPLRQGHPHDRRRRRRRPHPHACCSPCSSATCARWSRPAGSTPPCRRCTASRSSTRAARRTSTSTPTPRPSCTALLAELDAQGQAGQGPAPALQGPRRDGRRPARRDHDGPPPPHPAPGHGRRRSRPPSGSSSCSWATTSPRARSSSSTAPHGLDRDRIDA